jgi:outer membrane protein insertion porin family
MMMLFLMSSCNSTRYLEKDQSLLKRTKIIFKNEKSVENKKSLEAELATFIDQKPNEKLLFFIPKEWLYLTNNQPDDNAWYKKGIKSLGDPPVIYSEAASKKIAGNMENHLKFKKGFYKAKVDFIVEEKKSIQGWSDSHGSDVWESNISKVTYIVSLGDRFKVKNVRYESQDKKLLTFVESLQENAFVKKGDYIDFAQFELEKSRLTVELQNHGYSNFSNNFIEISGDSSQVNKDVDIFFQFRTALPDTIHTKFVTGEVKVYTDYFKEQVVDSLSADTINMLQFYRQSSSFLVKPSLLSNSIFFKQGSLLRRDDRQKTFRKLNSLGTYRFVTVNARVDKDRDSIMNFEILLTPFQKKWIFDGSLEGYFSTLGAARLFGFSVSSQFVNRNFLGGSEKYTLRAEAGTEVGYARETGFVQRTTNLSLQNNLNIPSFQDFIGLGRLANRSGIIRDKFYKNFVEEASTNIGLGFSALNIINFYSLSTFNASFGFDYTSPKGNRYVFKPLGFNLDLYSIKDTTRFEQNPLILLSFKDILGTGFVFRDFSYIYTKTKDRKGNSMLAINNLEVSGWEVHLTNLLYNAISGSDREWVLDDKREIAFAKYIRYEFDGRYNKEYTKTTSFASRLNFGIIVPFGNNPSAPFIRQFGVGGPNSLRAWNIKEPGPGGYRDPLAKLKETPVIFVNQGDIKLELNAEYRFKILLLLDGAFFVDAGNVWTLRDDPNRPGAVISSKFLDQMAIGAGYGIRFNFNFFIIRFDCGYKLRSPFEDPYKKSQWYSFKEIRQQGLGNVQVAVNYPF